MSTPQRNARRTKAVAFHDSALGLTVYKPVKPGDPGEDGAWRASYHDPVTGQRKQPRLRGTRDEVRREFKKLAKDIERKRSSDWRKRTFRELVDLYLADHGLEGPWDPQVERNQRQVAEGLLCDHTLLGDATMDDIAWSPATLRKALKQLANDYISDRTGRPLAQSSLRRYRDVLGTLISYAQHEELLPAEAAPMKDVNTPKAAPGAKRPATASLRDEDDDGEGRGLLGPSELPSLDDAERLAKVWVDRTPGNPWWRRLSVCLACTAGLRWGEQHALRPCDICWDDEAPYIDVRRKLLVAKNGSVVGTGKPKGGKVRKALLPLHLADDLKRRCAEVTADQGPRGLLFPSPMDPSRPYEPDSFGTSMRNFAKRAGWPVDEHGLLVWTWHSMRHTAAVWQLRDVGIDVATVSEALGHASVTFTLRRYVGETSDARRIAAEQMREWRP